MRTPFTLRQITLAALTLAAAGAAQATNGYFSHGYGIKAKGMGGASVAMAQDAFAGANNPAAAAFAGNRWDLGADVFMPKRSVNVTGFTQGDVQSGKKAFFVPEFGYNVALSNKLALGLTVYGNGGMNTSYPSIFPGDINLFQGSGKLGVDLIQLIVAPTVAYKFSDNHSFGVSPLFVYQRFQAYGLQNPAFLDGPNQGTDDSTGMGVRLGYQGKLNDVLTVGASYSPKINMSRFDKYANLFAEAGDFDIPENYTLGFALQATPEVQIALDFQRINYSKVRSIGNSMMEGGPLGAGNGSGFGWTDVNVVKLGVQWKASEQWTFRAGYNHGDNPIKPEEITFNVLAPGVVKSHITLGATYSPSKTDEWSFAYMHAKKNTVSSDSFNSFPVPASISMSQNSVGIQYSRKF